MENDSNRIQSSETDADSSAAADNNTPSQLKINRFDSVTAFLLALIIFSSLHVLVLISLWMKKHDPSSLERQPTVQPAGTTASLTSVSTDFESPADNEVEYLIDPSIVMTLKLLPNLANTLAFSSIASEDGNQSRNSIGSDGPRSAGPASSENEIVPLWERWEIAFETSGKKQYAAQLDHFNIHLAAFGGGPNVIEIASQLSANPQRTIIPKPASEKRLYFSWEKDNPLLSFDRQLLAAAGISTTARNVVRLIPKDLESHLLELERQYCQQRGRFFPQDIAKTRFKNHPTSHGYEFRVDNQRYQSTGNHD